MNNKANHKCRYDCGACCIAPSISSEIPGMKSGKPAGIKCIHLTNDYLCDIFYSDERPSVCKGFRFDPIICGSSQTEAMEIMESLEMNKQ
jgi:uncharacterized protein